MWLTDLAIINVPAYRLLVVVNRAVSDTWIIWVNLEPKMLDGLAKLLVVKQTSHHRSIDGVVASEDQSLDPFFVSADIWTIDIRCDFHQDIH